MVKDKFNNISAAITNNKRKIKLNLIKNKKLAKFNKLESLQLPLLPPYIGFDNIFDANSLS